MSQPVVFQSEDWIQLQVLFSSYCEGDPEAVSRLFSELGKRIHRFFLTRTRSAIDSDDLTQASLLKIHLSRHSFNRSMSLKTWVFTVAQRTLIDHWRKSSRIRDAEVMDAAESFEDFSGDQSVLDLASQISLRRSLEDVLQNLKPLDRSIVYLSVTEGLSMAELAHVLESTEGAVKVRVHRLMKGLREQLQAREDDAQGEQA